MIEAVFLDLDGTLVDPKPGITGSVIHALRTVGVEPPAVETLTWVIGPPLDQSLAQLGAPDPSAALAAYRAHYQAGAMYEVSLYCGVEHALAQLAQSYRLILATAKPHVFARKITAHVGLDRHLTDQFGPELDGTRNDKASLLEHACTQLRFDPRRCVMVGDRGMDMVAAEANGMPFVAALWGYAEAGELDAAELRCARPSDLPAVLAGV